MGMMRTYGVLLTSFLTLALEACEALPPETYSNRGDPERQLAVSSQMDAVDLTAPGALEVVSDALKHNRPDYVIMGCMPDNAVCKKVASMMNDQKVTLKWGAPEDSVTLAYERVSLQECENSYIDNVHNQANLAHPSFGCSMRTNTVQMVSDKKQFIAPTVLDKSDGEKAAQNYESYANHSPAASVSAGTGTSLIGSGVQ